MDIIQPPLPATGDELSLEGSLDVDLVEVTALRYDTDEGPTVGLSVRVEGERVVERADRPQVDADTLLLSPATVAALVAAIISTVAEADPVAAGEILATVVAELDAGVAQDQARIAPVRFRFPGDERVPDRR